MKLRQSLIYLTLSLICLFLIISCQVLKPDLKTETQPQTLRLGFNNWPGCAVWQIASEQGIFEKNHLDVNLQFSDYSTGLTALESGQVEGNCQTLYDTIYILGTTAKKVDQVVVALTDWSTGGDQVIVAPGLKNIQQLKGKKVAVETGIVDHFMFLLALEKYKLKSSDMTIVNQGLIPNIALFLEEEIDAVVTYIPFVQEALNRPGSQTLLTSQEFPGAISDHLVVTRQFLETHPQQVQGLVNSWFDTVEFIRKNPDLSNQIIASASGLTLQDLKEYGSQIQLKGRSENLTAFQIGETFSSLPYASQKIYEFLQKNKLIQKSVNIEQILNAEFMRNSR
ncbi:ABC transporter, substrate-binding protein, aliphatic sulfonates family [Planktothrix serta PCC 8927]|uniref:ABC transporter, substrate-binding protein, aliphatic sulfonates family n=1 Tax=Planktothrix serta PCC 8927 TaxID=671068 RepID=A0A7Z9C005_9CYAN|nr:ABC transporter substrate-binding protein [Planktothrix serta]VXD24796.1 ABC transporter, substrate-binding protein, aliphatic sulfonates family [Planktothrix serta PCC 8927]